MVMKIQVTPQMEAARISKTLVSYHITIWHHKPQDHNSYTSQVLVTLLKRKYNVVHMFL